MAGGLEPDDLGLLWPKQFYDSGKSSVELELYLSLISTGKSSDSMYLKRKYKYRQRNPTLKHTLGI